MRTVETELKLALAPRTLARVAADPLLGAATGPSRALRGVYYDTRRHGLWKRGLSLRVRREGDRWVQTIKGGGSVDSGLHRRDEISRRVTRSVPDLSRLGRSASERAVAAIARRAALGPAFEMEIERQARTVAPAPGSEIEVSLDRGSVRSGKSRAAICEIELELKRGPAAAVFALAQAIAERYPVRIEQRSKAERGFELIGAARAAPVRGSLRVLRRDMTAAQAFRAAAASCLNHLQSNQLGALRGKDPEYLHQARVALRRLRSVLDAFADLLPEAPCKAYRKTLRRLTRVLGPAREWDVFIAETLQPVATQFPGHRGLAALGRAADRMREAAYRSSRRALSARRTQALLLELGGWLESAAWCNPALGEAAEWQAAVRVHASAILSRYRARLLRRGRGIRGAGLGRLHRLRIATKRLRYAAGYFAPLYARDRATPMLRALNDLQDALGAINDCATAASLVGAAHRAARGPLRVQAKTIVAHWNAALLAERREALKRLWKALRRCEPFWS